MKTAAPILCKSTPSRRKKSQVLRITVFRRSGSRFWQARVSVKGKIKRITGLRGGEIGEALMAGDTDAILAITVIASERANDPVTLDDLEDMPFGSIRVEAEEDEDPSQAAEADAGNGGTDAQVTPVDGGTPDSQGSTE